MAVTTRAGEGHSTRGVVFHSDRGSEYGAATFEAACILAAYMASGT